MNVSDKKCTYFLMDWLKFIFCLFVVGIHTDLFSENPSFRFWIDRGLFKIAVPYFALASSFLLGSKINNGTDIKQTITNYTKRMLTLLIVFEPISLVLNIVIMLLNNKEPMVIIAKTGLSILFAPPGALWYIQALVVGAWLAYPFIIKQQINFGIGLGGYYT